METITYNNILFTKIKDFKDYYISKCGKVLSTKKYHGTNIRILSNVEDGRGLGYSVVGLMKNKKHKLYYIHRLIALTFIPNPENKKEVNHIDGNPNNNYIKNLEWCTHSENILHSYRVLKRKSAFQGKIGKLCKNSKKVKQLDLNGNLIKIWDCQKDVERELNILQSNISACCSGVTKTSGGFKWKY